MSGISAIYILDSRAKVIISRDYRGDVMINISEQFSNHVLNIDEEAHMKPIFSIEGNITVCYVKVNNLYIVSVTKRNVNAMMNIAFLYRIANIFKSYFKHLEEESIRDNFVITYELLDEMMDNGYPQITDVKMLRDFIKNEAHQSSSSKESSSKQTNPSMMTHAVSWRPEGIVYRKNEIFLDVVEKLNLSVAADGTILRSEILGSLQMKSFLSGMPELKLGLNDKILLEAAGKASKGHMVELEDIKFHQCVRLARFENDRTISFIPPDGEFELLSYRQSTQVKPLIWVEAMVDHTKSSKTRIQYIIKAKSQFKARSIANRVEIKIPVPADAGSANFKASMGHVKYHPDKDLMVWSIKQFSGQRDIHMTASFSLPSVGDDSRNHFMKRPVEVSFEIPYFTVSGITVRYLKIIEKSGYQALPWVRYITQNGEYQLRLT